VQGCPLLHARAAASQGVYAVQAHGRWRPDGGGASAALGFTTRSGVFFGLGSTSYVDLPG